SPTRARSSRRRLTAARMGAPPPQEHPLPRFRYDADFDGADDLPTPRRSRPPRRPHADRFDDPREAGGATLSTYAEADHGPRPVPDWVITSGDALDVERGPIKTGKEADVHLLERRDPDTGRVHLLAAKRYRAADHRLFHRD